MDPSHRSRRRAGYRSGWLLLKLLELGLRYCELRLLHVFLALPKYWPRILWRTAALGTVLCCVYELVLGVPGFPFWTALRLPLSCAALLALNRLLGPKPPQS